MPQTGARSRNGRFMRTARAKPRSLAVARVGPVRFTGPATSVSITCRIALISSSSEIQGHTWVPRPIGPLSPKRVSSMSGLSTPLRVHDRGGAQQGDPGVRARRERRGLPFAAQVGEEGLAARGVLGQPHSGGRAVVADRGRRDQCGCRRPERLDGRGELLGGRQTRPEQGVLVALGPGEAPDARAVQADDRVGALQALRDRAGRSGQPLDLIRRLRGPPHERRHAHAVATQAVDERRADQARSPGDHDVSRSPGFGGFRQASPRG